MKELPDIKIQWRCVPTRSVHKLRYTITRIYCDLSTVCTIYNVQISSDRLVVYVCIHNMAWIGVHVQGDVCRRVYIMYKCIQKP